MKYIKIISLLIFIISIFIYNSCKNSNPSNEKENIIIEPEEEAEIINITPEKKTNETENLLIEMGLIRIKDSIPEILIDLKYADTSNFIGISFYGELAEAYMQSECFEKLKSAYRLLQEEKPGYTFIIYDAVRSIEAQKLMWDSVKVPQNQKFWYVANPEKGSIHNYGMALDLSIADNFGNILDMGTEFDYFGELSFPNKTEYYYNIGSLTKEHVENRNLLFSIMKKAGFYVSKTEWWHFNASSLEYAKTNYTIFSIENKNVN